MRINSGRDARLILPFTVACLLLASFAMVFGAGVPPGYIALINIPLFAFLVIPYSYIIWREIELDAKGCTISFLRFRRRYAWDELMTKHVENYADRAIYKSPFDRAVLLLSFPPQKSATGQ